MRAGFGGQVPFGQLINMNQFLTFGNNGLQNTGTPQYSSPTGANSFSTILNNYRVPVSSAINVSKLYVHINAPAGAGKNVTCTIFRNGVATALSVVCSGAIVVHNNNTTDTITFLESDEITVELIADAGSASDAIEWCFLSTII